MAFAKRPFAARQTGITLLEFIIVIGVVAVIVLVAILLYSRARAEQRDVEMVQKVHALETVIHQIYREPKYGSLSGPLLAQTSSIARGMADGAGNLHATWGGAITVGPGTYAGVTGATFELAFDGAPPNHCIALVRDALIAPTLKVTVGSTILKDMSADPVVVISDLDSTVTACQGASTPTIRLVSS